MSLPGNASHVTDHEECWVLQTAHQPGRTARSGFRRARGPGYRAQGAGAAGRYYGQLVEHGHSRLVEVGTERAVRKQVSRPSRP